MDITSELYKWLEEVNLWYIKISLKRNEYLKVGGAIETDLFYIVSGSLKISIIGKSGEHSTYCYHAYCDCQYKNRNVIRRRVLGNASCQ